MQSEADDHDEEMKIDSSLDEIPLLKKMSSEMQVAPYRRVIALAHGVQLLERLVKQCKADGQVSEHPLLRTGKNKEAFKASVKTVFDVCIIKDLEV